MYKQYVLSSNEHSGTIGGQSSEHWTDVWRGRGFSSERQLATFGRTAQWRYMKEVLPDRASILEAGCGLGSWVRFLDRMGYDCTGLDFSAETIDRLVHEFPDNKWVCGDIQSAPFPDETFNVVCSWGVVEHFEEGPGNALRELFRVLKPGGILFATVPWLSPRRVNLGWVDGGSNFAKLDENEEKKFAQYYLTESELHSFLLDAGFSAARIEYSSLHAKSLLPISVRNSFPVSTKVFNKIMSPILPSKLIASMILGIATK